MLEDMQANLSHVPHSRRVNAMQDTPSVSQLVLSRVQDAASSSDKGTCLTRCDLSRMPAHHDNVSEAVGPCCLLLDLVYGLNVAPRSQRIGAAHRDHIWVQPLAAQLFCQAVTQCHAAMLNILLFCDLCTSINDTVVTHSSLAYDCKQTH